MRDFTVEEGRVFDEGLQAERTSLSWERTALTLAANAALLTHVGTEEGAGWVRILGFVFMGLVALVFLFSRSRYVRRDAAMRGREPYPRHQLMLGVGIGAMVSSAAILVVAIIHAVRTLT